jgi:hypothetical protein
MTLAKKQKPVRIKTALRIPEELHAEIKKAADLNDRSINAEILARLSHTPILTSLDSLQADSTDIKALAQEILRTVRQR